MFVRILSRYFYTVWPSDKCKEMRERDNALTSVWETVHRDVTVGYFIDVI